MRTVATLCLGVLCLSLTGCGSKPAPTDRQPTLPAATPAPTGPAPAKPQELIVGRWDMPKGAAAGVPWDELSESIDAAEHGVGLLFQKDGTLLISPADGLGGLVAKYTLGADGTLEMAIRALSTDGEAQVKLKVKAQVTADVLTLTDAKGKTEKFKRGRVIETVPAPKQPEPSPEQKAAADALTKLGAGVQFESTQGGFIRAGAPRDVPLYAIVYTNKVKGLNTALAEMSPHLAKLPALHLDVDGLDDTGCAALKGLTNLDYLAAAKATVSDAGLANVAKLTNLRVLAVESPKLTDAAYAHLAGLSNLRAFTLRANQFGARNTMTDASLAQLKNLTKLQELDLESASASPITDAGLAHLQGLTQLRRLDLNRLDITDESLKHLAGMTAMDYLSFSGCSGLTGAGFVHLRGMKDLNELELRYCAKLTAAGASHLSALTGIKRLMIQRSFSSPEHYRGISGLINLVGSSRVDLQACKLEYSIVSPK